MATKKNTSRKRSQRNKPPVTGSPITIGGGGGRRVRGGVTCQFNHNDYPDPAPGNRRKKKFQSRLFNMRSLKITINRQELDFTQLLPEDGRCEVNVFGSESDDNLKIIGQNFGVEFHDGIYRQGLNPSIHFNDSNHVEKVEVKGPDFSFNRKFDPDDRCVILADRI